MTKLMILGLPTREQVRRLLAFVLAPAVLAGVKWIRVPQQLADIERGSKLYLLPGGAELLELEPHRELDQMIVSRGIDKCDVTPAALAQVLAANKGAR